MSQEIPIDKIFIGEVNVRKNLGDLLPLINSIKEKGVLQPILVRPSEGKFEVVCGARRLEAAKAAGLKTIPAIVRELSDRDAIAISLTENLHRDNLDLEERIVGYEKLKKANRNIKTDRDLARLLNIPRTKIIEDYEAYAAFLKLSKEKMKVEVRPTKMEERKKGKSIPRQHAVLLERTFKKVESKIPEEEREKKYVQLAKVIAPLEQKVAKRVLNHFVVHPEKPVEEIKREVLEVHDIPVTVNFTPRVFGGLVRAAEERGITVEQLVKNIVEDWLKRGGYLAQGKSS